MERSRHLPLARTSRLLALSLMMSASMLASPAVAQLGSYTDPADIRFATPEEGERALDQFLSTRRYDAELDAEIALSYGQALLDLDRLNDARRVLEDSYDRIKKREAGDQVQAARVLQARAKVDAGLGRWSSRRNDLKRAYKSFRKAYGSRDRRTLVAKLDYGESLLDEGYAEFFYGYSFHGFGHGGHGSRYRFGQGTISEVSQSALELFGPSDDLTLRSNLVDAAADINVGRYRSAVKPLERVVAAADTQGDENQLYAAIKGRELLELAYAACGWSDKAAVIHNELEALLGDPQPGIEQAPEQETPSMYPPGTTMTS